MPNPSQLKMMMMMMMMNMMTNENAESLNALEMLWMLLLFNNTINRTKVQYLSDWTAGLPLALH
jgi:hypothetical protein